ncbi:hypothetical protein CNR22_01760 [Sphingobacteriaceae bacterium]|nr:hypothetical protein CNR22_01760 [Sphingobacteriaceae bacterium]
MKKLYTTQEYKDWHKKKLKKIQIELKSKNYAPIKRKKSIGYQRQAEPVPLIAPRDFRLLTNTEQCLGFFRDVRDEKNQVLIKNIRFLVISMSDIEHIDYATISVLSAICEDFTFRNIAMRGLLPRNPACKKIIVDSGFLNRMYDDNQRKFTKFTPSDVFVFEKGGDKFTDSDNIRIGELIKEVSKHLTGVGRHFNPVKTILLEICGNAIEHSDSLCKQWLLGVMYEKDKVVFTVTDVGRGILETLYRKPLAGIKDMFTLKEKHEILNGAFEQKYGSRTREINRNKGLPAVKYNSEMGYILNLIVVTNNVILYFGEDSESSTFLRGAPRLKGTFYQWEVTKECIDKVIVKKS